VEAEPESVTGTPLCVKTERKGTYMPEEIQEQPRRLIKNFHTFVVI